MLDQADLGRTRGAGQPALASLHDPWDRIVRAHVVPTPDGLNRFAYARAKTDAGPAIGAYLRSLEAVAVSRLPRAEQFVFWINLYNALTIKTVLDHYPVRSIKRIRPSRWRPWIGPFAVKQVSVEGRMLSLRDVEHGIIRPHFKEPRAHYAINCASYGCPNLQPVAFTADNVETLMDSCAQQFVNHTRAVSIEKGRLIVSSIFVWYGEDFGPNDAAVIAHLARYAEPALKEALRGRTKIDGHQYDWSINDVGGGAT
ncbi:MAG: DUF547 domain-containing protein [Alphaproteobacteria bacterium]